MVGLLAVETSRGGLENSVCDCAAPRRRMFDIEDWGRMGSGEDELPEGMWWKTLLILAEGRSMEKVEADGTDEGRAHSGESG